MLTPGLAWAQTTTVQPFGRGYIINTPGQMPTTVQPFGRGYIINNPNQNIFDN